MNGLLSAIFASLLGASLVLLLVNATVQHAELSAQTEQRAELGRVTREQQTLRDSTGSYRSLVYSSVSGPIEVEAGTADRATITCGLGVFTLTPEGIARGDGGGSTAVPLLGRPIVRKAATR